MFHIYIHIYMTKYLIYKYGEKIFSLARILIDMVKIIIVVLISSHNLLRRLNNFNDVFIQHSNIYSNFSQPEQLL